VFLPFVIVKEKGIDLNPTIVSVGMIVVSVGNYYLVFFSSLFIKTSCLVDLIQCSYHNTHHNCKTEGLGQTSLTLPFCSK
jgi:hypothetical protein